MKRILFVDDESKVLEALRRMLRGLRREWDMDFVESGQEALARLGAGPFDVVVTDMRMPLMDGSQLLREVIQRRPAAVRIILSGQCDRATVLKAVGPTHQFLTKPCDPDTLIRTIARACAARDRLPDDRTKQAVTCVGSLPACPETHARLADEAGSVSATAQRLGEIIASDVAMTAKIVQLVNSGFFGTPQRTSDPVAAAHLLGVETVRALVQETDAFSASGAAGWKGFPLQRMNAHARAVAAAAARIAQNETGSGRMAADAALAGMLHDIGLLVLAAELHERYAEAADTRRTGSAHVRQEADDRLLVSSDDVGAYLLELWGAPEAVVRAVANRCHPGRAGDTAFSPLTALHAASALLDAGMDDLLGTAAPVDTDYLRAVGCEDRLDRWRETCLEAACEGVCP